MITIGLTGSIGMGKSTVTKMFADLGAATWSADDAVHRLYAEGGDGVEPIEALFPSVVRNNMVDRAALAAIVLRDPAALKRLEAVVHPLVGADREAMLAVCIDAGEVALVLDIPLLFEGGAEKACAVVVVVSAPAAVQRARVLARPGMSEAAFAAILAEQTPDAQKRARADYIIDTDQPLEKTRARVGEVYAAILRDAGAG